MGSNVFIDFMGGLFTGAFGVFIIIILIIWIIVWFLVPFYIYAINRNIRSLLSKNNTTLVNILFTLDLINKKFDEHQERALAEKESPTVHGKN